MFVQEPNWREREKSNERKTDLANVQGSKCNSKIYIIDVNWCGLKLNLKKKKFIQVCNFVF